MDKKLITKQIETYNRFLKSLLLTVLLIFSDVIHNTQYVVRIPSNKFLKSFPYYVLLATCYFLLSAPAEAGTIIKSPSYLGLNSGLIGHWTFDGPDISGTRAKDKSGFNNHGTITGATQAMGKIGQGLSFDGLDDQIQVSDHASLDLASSYTLSARVRANNLSDPGSSVYYAVLSKGQSGETSSNNHNFLFGYNWNGTFGTTDRWVFVLENGVGTNCNLTGNTSAQGGLWYHIVAVFNNTEDISEIFVNGASDGEISCTLTPNNNALVARIGDNGFTSSSPWNGVIDDVRIYNRALSQAEITKLYNMGR